MPVTTAFALGVLVGFALGLAFAALCIEDY